MIYDPNNELTEEEMTQLSEDEFFEYLDTQAEYLKTKTRPLGQYHTKMYAALTKGDKLTTKELKTAKEIGQLGDNEVNEKIAEATSKLGGDPKYDDVTNVKTNRTQWFD